MKKDDYFVKAVNELRKMVDDSAYGNIQFNFQNGVLVNYKKETTGKFIDEGVKPQ
jgi:hypothetical protein